MLAALALLALPLLGGCAAPQETDDGLSGPERAKLEVELERLDRQIAEVNKKLRAAKKAQGRHAQSITKAERSAGVATGSGATLSTGGLTSSAPTGTHLRLKLNKATWTLSPRFRSAKRKGKRTLFPFSGGYRSKKR